MRRDADDRAEDYVKSVVDEAPQLNDEQRDKLAVLLRGAVSAASTERAA